MCASARRSSVRAADGVAIQVSTGVVNSQSLPADLSRFRQNVGIDGLMAILIFVLSLVLLVAGAASGYQSLDLLPDGLGVLYALAGAVGVAAAVVTFAIGVAIRRIDALARLVRQSAAPAILDTAPDSEPAPAPWIRRRKSSRRGLRRPSLRLSRSKRRRRRAPMNRLQRTTRARSTSIAPAICPRSMRSRPCWRRRRRRRA